MPAFAGVRAFMEDCLNSWVGYPVDSLIRVWGYPSDEREIAGKHLLYFNRSRVGYVPQTSNTTGNLNSYGNVYGNTLYSNGTYNANTVTYGGYSVTYYCNRIIEVDADNNIVSWQWEGNVCPGTYFKGKAWVNPENDKWALKKAMQQHLKAERKQAKEAKKQAKKVKQEDKDI